MDIRVRITVGVGETEQYIIDRTREVQFGASPGSVLLGLLDSTTTDALKVTGLQ